MENTNITPKEMFLNQWAENVHREGSDKLLAWLEESDFFTAPASTRFHGNYEGGLCVHSLNVFRHFARLCNTYKAELGIASWKDKAESVAICALLHDVCKIGLYTVEMRNKKNEEGQWVKEPFYIHDEKQPMGGHGFKSVFLISDFMKLSDEERVTVANHMGAFDRAPGDYALGPAWERYPFAMLLHMADCMATFVDEVQKVKA